MHASLGRVALNPSRLDRARKSRCSCPAGARCSCGAPKLGSIVGNRALSLALSSKRAQTEGGARTRPVQSRLPEQPRVDTIADPSLGCSLNQLDAIGVAARDAAATLQWLVWGMDHLLRSPPAEAADPIVERIERAMRWRFGTTAPNVVRYVRDRFQDALNVMQHSPTMLVRCADGLGCEGRAAHYGAASNTLTFCPPFFEPARLPRAVGVQTTTIIHEVMHAQQPPHPISDIAYANERYFRHLPTHLTLVNASSYEIFVADVFAPDSSLGPRGSLSLGPLEEVSGCPDGDRALAALALAEAYSSRAFQATSQRNAAWLGAAFWRDLRQRHLGGEEIALVEAAMQNFAELNFDFTFITMPIRCHPASDPICSGPSPSLGSRELLIERAVHLCSSWQSLPLGEQAMHILAALLAAHDATPRSPEDVHLGRARLAREFYEGIIVGPAPSSLSQMGL